MYSFKKYLIFTASVLLLVIVVTSCKKETIENTNCCCPAVAPTPPYQKPLGLIQAQGFFVFQKFYTVNTNTITLDSTSSYVKPSPKGSALISYINYPEFYQNYVDSVKINNIKFKRLLNISTDTTFTAFNIPRTCTLYADTNYYDLINYTDNTAFPDYLGYNSLPDSVFYNNDFVVNVGNRNNVKETEIFIEYKKNSWLFTSKHLSNSETSFTIPSDNLPYDYQKDNVSITVKLRNWNSIKINNREYYFVTECIYNKP